MCRLPLAAATAFTPASISGMIYWDAADLTKQYQTGNRAAPGAAVAADGDPVGVVLDKSTSQIDVLQATTTKRPLYKTGSGLSWWLFDGVDDFLQTAATFALTNGSGEHSSGAAVQFASVTGVRSIIDSDIVTRTSQNIRLNAGVAESLAFNTVPTAFTDTAGSISAAADKVMTEITKAASVEVFVDGVGNGSTAITGSAQNAVNFLELGANGSGLASFFSGRKYRAYYIPRALTVSEHAQMVTWLGAGQGRAL